MTDRPWYEELFESGDYLRFWVGGEAAEAVAPERTAAEVEFLVEALELRPGARVVDLACGYGRHSIALAARGFRLTGIDLSGRHLDLARKAAAEANVTVEWIRADMREIPASLAGQADGVINMFTAFGYLENDGEDQRVLDAVATALRPGGRFFIDFINRERVMREFRPEAWSELGDAFVLRRREFDFLTGRNLEAITVVEADGARRITGTRVRMYTVAELAAMLTLAGLRPLQAWGDFDGSRLDFGSRRVLLMAEKPA